MDQQALIGQQLKGSFQFYSHHPLIFEILIKSLQNTHFLCGLGWTSPKVLSLTMERIPSQEADVCYDVKFPQMVYIKKMGYHLCTCFCVCAVLTHFT